MKKEHKSDVQADLIREETYPHIRTHVRSPQLAEREPVFFGTYTSAPALRCLCVMLFTLGWAPLLSEAAEFHVSVRGDDINEGTASRPFRTISAAANIAQPGDVITVHGGTYRERINPPRGGASHAERIIYRAAEGESAIIKGSEIIRDWRPFRGDVWKATVPNSLFGNYNPYTDLIAGDWFTDKGRPHHTGAVYLNGKSLWETHELEQVLDPAPTPDVQDPEGSTFTWFCESDDQNTYLFANFHGLDPNEERVEINVRKACFYPSKPGRDYITIRGFRMSQAATQWAAPTAEQIGLIGTHWSKGWIIENNFISDSRCSGITLGKDHATGHNVWSNNPEKDGATHYNEVIERALKAGWSKATIGSHIVRNNTIFNCEQTGICGSLGGIFSRIENNHIYNIWTKRQFTGAEMAGIKIHASIDMLIRNNRIHNTGRGMWMDWMAQGTRITGNLCYDNSTDDLFVEVNHGPFLVDNNLLLSSVSLRDWSQGGAYAHNLFTGQIYNRPVLNRSTPYHRAHSTELVALSKIPGGDNRFFNNILVGDGSPIANLPKPETKPDQRVTGFGLWVYDSREYSLLTGGNVHCNGSLPYFEETEPLVLGGFDPGIKIVKEGEQVFLKLSFGTELGTAQTFPVTTERLGTAIIPKLGFETADGSPLIIDTDYQGAKRSATTPTAGPFETSGQGIHKLKVW